MLPLDASAASTSSVAVSVTVEPLLTYDIARCVMPVGAVTFSAPLWPKNPTRRPPSAVAVTEGPWVTIELRVYLPELATTGALELTPEYARTDPAAPVAVEKEKE